MLFIDRDGCKQVNDTNGHHVGDELLVAVTSRQAALVRSDDTLARVAGDGNGPGWPMVAISENAPIDDAPGARLVLDELCATGARIALDDFGTGFSSLSSLPRGSIDGSKIDGSFVADVDQRRGHHPRCGHETGTHAVATGHG